MPKNRLFLPDKLGIIVNLKKKNARDITKKMIYELLGAGKEIYLTPKLAEIINDDRCKTVDSSDLDKFTDTLITVGGDGTFIGVAREYSRRDMKILPVNIGYLGFLSEMTADQFLENFKLINSDEIHIEKRMMLEISTLNFSSPAVNEITVSPKSLSRLISINININDKHFTNIRADGIIISTPTGSTGHSLSAGGPIINPNLNCFSLTPLCAHSLAVRPIILSPDDTIEISHSSKSETAALTVDGQLQIPLRKNMFVKIRRAAHTFNLIKLNKLKYYDLIKAKLKWNQ